LLHPLYLLFTGNWILQKCVMIRSEITIRIYLIVILIFPWKKFLIFFKWKNVFQGSFLDCRAICWIVRELIMRLEWLKLELLVHGSHFLPIQRHVHMNKKYLFIYIYNIVYFIIIYKTPIYTVWCPSCRRLLQDVLPRMNYIFYPLPNRLIRLF
jgi:hypothetical protein